MSRSSPAAAEAETKGTNFLGTLRSLRDLRGKEVHDAVVAALQGPVGDAIRDGHLVPVGWYPVSWYVELQDTIQRVTGAGVAITRALATATTLHDFTVLHRLVVRMLSTVLRHTHRLLQLYWRGGTIELVEQRMGVVVFRLRGWRGFEPVVWEDVAASMEALFSVVGGKGARMRVLTVSADRRDADIEARSG